MTMKEEIQEIKTELQSVKTSMTTLSEQVTVVFNRLFGNDKIKDPGIYSQHEQMWNTFSKGKVLIAFIAISGIKSGYEVIVPLAKVVFATVFGHTLAGN